MDIRELRSRIGTKWSKDDYRVAEEAERLATLEAEDPDRYEAHSHLWGAQWYRGGPISQQDLADLLGVGKRSVERWEAGEAVPHRLAQKALEELWEAT